jgi:hypothetical protein
MANRKRRTYYWRIPLLPRDLRRMAELTPGYDPDQCEEMLRDWWYGSWLSGENLQVSAHLSSILTVEELVRRFDFLDLSSQPRNRRAPSSARPKWVLVRMPPEAMDASRKARSRLRKWGADVADLDEFRTVALRDMVLDVYGGDPERGWD